MTQHLKRPHPARSARPLLIATALLGASCGSDGESANSPEVSVEQAESSPEIDSDRAIDSFGNLQLEHELFPDPLVDPEDIKSGGPDPDGIPPIDQPRFVAAEDVDFLEDNEPVIVLGLDGETRAYPIQILIWHEIVNDTVSDVPVAVTYCPLCNSAYAWDRRVEEKTLDFGTSGKLWNSSLVMYDRQSGSLWGHFTGQSIAGVFSGTSLDSVPVTITSWNQFVSANPTSLVLSRETGEERPYGENPYPGYEDIANPIFAPTDEADPRLEAKERVVGVEVGNESVAIRRSIIEDERFVEFSLGNRELVALWSPNTVSALDGHEVSSGREIGSINVLDLTDTGLEITQTGTEPGTFLGSDQSTYDILGKSIRGPAEGSRLETEVHVDTFWFAWGAFKPNTDVIDG